MSLTEAEKQTINYYDSNAREWAAVKGGERESSYWIQQLQIFQHFLPSGDILEIGPGVGREAKWFLDNNYNYVGIDPSSGILDLARQKNPSATFLNIETSELKLVNRQFDGFWAAASLLHVPKLKIDSVLQDINNALNKKAIGFVTLKEGIGEIEDETGRLYSYYSEAKSTKILERNGFEVLRKEKLVDDKTTWLMFFVKKI